MIILRNTTDLECSGFNSVKQVLTLHYYMDMYYILGCVSSCGCLLSSNTSTKSLDPLHIKYKA